MISLKVFEYRCGNGAGFANAGAKPQASLKFRMAKPGRGCPPQVAAVPRIWVAGGAPGPSVLTVGGAPGSSD